MHLLKSYESFCLYFPLFSLYFAPFISCQPFWWAVFIWMYIQKIRGCNNYDDLSAFPALAERADTCTRPLCPLWAWYTGDCTNFHHKLPIIQIPMSRSGIVLAISLESFNRFLLLSPQLVLPGICMMYHFPPSAQFFLGSFARWGRRQGWVMISIP